MKIQLTKTLAIVPKTYADDLVLISESATGLQKSLDKLHCYTKKCCLEVNLDKTKIMVFYKKKEPKQFNLGPSRINKCKNYKYLGTIISKSGTFKLNEVNLKKKGLRASFLITQTIGQYAKPSTSINLFENIIEPILTYNCEISMAYIPLELREI